jgi:hypothetical protein
MSDTAKLTLKLDKELIEKAKQYANKHNTSVSQMVSKFFAYLGYSPSSVELGPITRRLHGSLKNIDAEHSLEENDYLNYLNKRYGTTTSSSTGTMEADSKAKR